MAVTMAVVSVGRLTQLGSALAALALATTAASAQTYGFATLPAGTLSHVTALSGYVTARDGELLVFSIMTNNAPGPPSAARQMEDGIAQALADFAR